MPTCLSVCLPASRGTQEQSLLTRCHSAEAELSQVSERVKHLQSAYDTANSELRRANSDATGLKDRINTVRVQAM